MKLSPSSQSRILNESQLIEYIHGQVRHYNGHTGTTYEGIRSITFLQANADNSNRERYNGGGEKDNGRSNGTQHKDSRGSRHGK